MRKWLVALVCTGIVAGAASSIGDDRMIAYRVTVQPGDTVYSIASRIATPRDDVNRMAWEIVKDNHIEMGLIYPGQEITVRVHPAGK